MPAVPISEVISVLRSRLSKNVKGNPRLSRYILADSTLRNPFHRLTRSRRHLHQFRAACQALCCQDSDVLDPDPIVRSFVTLREAEYTRSRVDPGLSSTPSRHLLAASDASDRTVAWMIGHSTVRV